ncbi:MAG: glycosyltransferase, partial [Actinobacteria bacterium]|nr:glycosyltransferase [Actinomycetota bacterium]
LARAIEAMLMDPELRRACVEEGRKNVQARFTWDRIAEENIAVYERVLSARAGAAS